MNPLKRALSLFAVLVLLGSCEKAIEKEAEDLVLQAMTSGQWKITNFVHNGNNITADFSTYRFKYYQNKTVDAINNGTVERTGQWDGNANAQTTWANFTGAVHPISLINGTWNIVNNSWTFVSATQNVGGETKTMRLDKE
jgi:hypothetical protein